MANTPNSRTFADKAILLVEDNRVNSEITAEILQHMGCEVVVAENGQEALQAASQRSFDIILMDCHMPVMDGFEATRELRKMMKQSLVRDTPIIALTGTSQQIDLEASLASGMNDIILKPARLDTMQAALTKWLDSGNAANLTAEDLKARSIVAISMPKDLPTEHFGIDTGIFEATREMLGDKFTTILGYYLEDADDYVTQLEEHLSKHNIAGVRDAAYALRSASRQLGIIELAYFADRMELSAQQLLAGAQANDLHGLLYSIQKEMDRIRPFIAEQCGQTKAA